MLYLSKPAHQEFEKLYVLQRQKEGRLLSDGEVKELPYLTGHSLEKEWQLRQQTTKRFISYLDGKPISTLMEIGCGNGWFSHLLAEKFPNISVWGIDINVKELEQAARVFKRDQNLRFAYWDVFQPIDQIPKPGLIVLNASVQYFPSIEKLLARLFEVLKAYGEIHIIDSPFYEEQEIPKASARSEEYYRESELPELSRFYHHHSLIDIERKYTVERKFDPTKFSVKLKKILGKKPSPFPWIKITK